MRIAFRKRCDTWLRTRRDNRYGVRIAGRKGSLSRRCISARTGLIDVKSKNLQHLGICSYPWSSNGNHKSILRRKLEDRSDLLIDRPTYLHTTSYSAAFDRHTGFAQSWISREFLSRERDRATTLLPAVTLDPPAWSHNFGGKVG